MRLLLWGVVLFAMLMWLLHLKKTFLQQSKRNHEDLQKAQVTPEAMVCCAHCGIHVPASEAVLARPELGFCSEEHRLKHFSR
jgi:uncharacterized protein